MTQSDLDEEYIERCREEPIGFGLMPVIVIDRAPSDPAYTAGSVIWARRLNQALESQQ